MSSEDLRAAYDIAREVCSFFNMPLPHIIITPNLSTLGECVDTTVYLKSNVALSKPEVVAHELAHYSHVYYGIPCRTPECETYARIFEEVWKASRGRGGLQQYKHSCTVCGYPLLQTKCLKCSTDYSYNGESMKCIVCGRTIYTSGSPRVIRCPACGAVYERARVFKYPGSFGDFMLGLLIGYFVLPTVIPTVGEFIRKYAKK